MQNNKNIPLSEYPRPELIRDSYICLNGEWDYAFTNEPNKPVSFEGKINVPFSPETPLSGVLRRLEPNQYLWYRRKIRLENDFIKDKVLLHFLAVDQIADVFINGDFAIKHIGGYLPFEVDIKPYLINNEAEILVKVQDFSDTSFYSRGKQTLNPKGIWYPAQSGIYMPVFIESVSNDYIKNIKIKTSLEDNSVNIHVDSTSKDITIILNNSKYKLDENNNVKIVLDNPHLWDINDPYLYEFEIQTKEDKVKSYFGFREIKKQVDASGNYKVFLNNKEIFIKGVLDQGYYKDSLLTPPSYDSYIEDINLVKKLGFNTIRKHIKIEAPRFYYECDKQGILVIQDFINGGAKYKFPIICFPLITNVHLKDNKYKLFARNEEIGRQFFKEESKEIIDYLGNHPSIIAWTIFNEGWGQFDAKKIYEELSSIDETRLFDHASGWHDQKVSDFKSMHVYLKRVRMPKKKNINSRIVFLSECGAYLLDHDNKKKSKGIAYSKTSDINKYYQKYKDLIIKDIIKNKKKGLAGFIYTQLTDVEGEINGFVSYDRKINKVDFNKIKEFNDLIDKQ